MCPLPCCTLTNPKMFEDLAVGIAVSVEQSARSDSPSPVSVSDWLGFTSASITATVATDVNGSPRGSRSSTARCRPAPTHSFVRVGAGRVVPLLPNLSPFHVPTRRQRKGET
jgi:hypothetical protein